MITSILYLFFVYKNISFDNYWLWFSIGTIVEYFIGYLIMEKDYNKHIEIED